MYIQPNTRDNTGLLDKTNTTTELWGRAVTSQGTLSTNDVTTMAPHFSPPSIGHFRRRNFILLMDANLWICLCSILLDTEHQAWKQHVPFEKSFGWLSRGLTHRPPGLARTITWPSFCEKEKIRKMSPAAWRMGWRRNTITKPSHLAPHRGLASMAYLYLLWICPLTFWPNY